MQTVVAKFGGTAIATAENIRQVAKKVLNEQARGINIIVVVSSMSSIRGQLRQFAQDITDEPSKRGMDVLIATGAQMTSALLAMAIQEQGGKAMSLAGWQAGIKMI